MSSTLTTPNDFGSILSRVIGPDVAGWSADTARAILRLEFTDADVRRMNELAGKSRSGTLEPDEELEIESYREAGRFLDLMKAKARLSLSRQGLSA